MVELLVYGDRITGRVDKVGRDHFSVRVSADARRDALQLSTAFGTAVVSLADGAANVPVSVRTSGDVLQIQVVGPAEFLQRRRHTRLTIRLLAVVCWQRGDRGGWERVATHTLDLSLGGVHVESAPTVWPSPGSGVLVGLGLPDGSLEIPSQVIGKTAAYGLRLEFVEPAAVEGRLRTLFP
jgi:hypothetical protein